MVNHQTGAAVTGEQRNMLVESARISHGGVVPLEAVQPEDLDALVIPGGLGFVKSVTTFGKDGAAFSHDAALGQLLTELHAPEEAARVPVHHPGPRRQALRCRAAAAHHRCRRRHDGR